jgi:hypothetical protein
MNFFFVYMKSPGKKGDLLEKVNLFTVNLNKFVYLNINVSISNKTEGSESGTDCVRGS